MHGSHRILALFLPALAFLLVGPGRAGADQPPRTLSISGTAVVKAPPDEVVLSFGIETRRALAASKRRDYVVGTPEAVQISAEILSDAQQGGEQSVKAVREALNAKGIEDKWIRMDSFQVTPETWNDEGVNYFRGYVCRYALTLTLKDPATTDSCVELILKKGATHIYDVTYQSTQIRKYRDDARRAACKAAREKADLLAQELGTKVKRILTISEGAVSVSCGKNWGQSYGRQSYYQSANTWQVEEFVAPTGELGELGSGDVAVSASVSCVFELE